MKTSQSSKRSLLKPLLLVGVLILATGGIVLFFFWNPFSAPEAVGQRAPDFTLSDADGQPLQLSALRDKPVLLYFSAAWCRICRPETRKLAELYEKYRGRLKVVWISFDPFNDVIEDLREHRRLWGHPDFLYALDSRVQPVSQLYYVQARGTMFLLNAQGQIVFRGIRAGDDPEFLRQLNQVVVGR